MYLKYYIMGIIVLPGLLLAVYTQTKVSSTFQQYNQIFCQVNITAHEFVQRLLSVTDLNYIRLSKIHGELTDHYNPRTEEICLSSSVYNSTSVAALGIACHEFGHALQKKEKYFPYQIRQVVIPLSNFASTMLWPLVIIGLIFNFGSMANSIVGDIFLWAGIGFFGLAVLVNLVTLPVEFNASNRAINILKTSGTLTDEELDGTKKVLKAAALTYVAALVVSILNLLRFLLVILSSRRRR